MPTNLDIANRALQLIGSRTNMSVAEFANNTSNEAIQANLIINQLRDELNRMAPWDCFQKWINLTYITSQPTTPENSGPGFPFWQRGTPAPPWAYEYQYPADCLRARWIMPQYTAQAGGVPIFPPGTATGANQVGWTGPSLKFLISTDQFFGVNSVTILTPGTGYAANDIITLSQPTFTTTQNVSAGGLVAIPQTIISSVGAPAQLFVQTVGAGGAITSVSVISQVLGETDSPSGSTATPIGGSYFSTAGALGTQGSTTGSGTGATFTLNFNPNAAGQPQPQRVILCNLENAILCYNSQITDPNVMDQLFQDAWTHILGARLVYQLSGDKGAANQLINATNAMIGEARKADGNEGLTINDVTPDWIRVRGNWGGPNWEYTPNMSFDWGSFYSPY